jgi:GTPase SAR1 family protein
MTPLHASAIDVADGCVTFIGDSGAGKSTLVAALAQRGYSVISDDICSLQLGTNQNVQAWPGISRIRLWEDARAALGYDGPGIEREIYGYNKYLIPVGPPRNPIQSRRLCQVFQLHRVPNGAPEVTRLQGAAAIEVLMRHVYGLGLAERLGYKRNAFIICAAVARDVPVYRFSRPWDLAAFGQATEMLEDHLSKLC